MGGTGGIGSSITTLIIAVDPAAPPSIAIPASFRPPVLPMTSTRMSLRLTVRFYIHEVLRVPFQVFTRGRDIEASRNVTSPPPHASRTLDPRANLPLSPLEPPPRVPAALSLPPHVASPVPIAIRHRHLHRTRATTGRLGCDATARAAAVPGRAGGAHGNATTAKQGGLVPVPVTVQPTTPRRSTWRERASTSHRRAGGGGGPRPREGGTYPRSAEVAIEPWQRDVPNLGASAHTAALLLADLPTVKEAE